MAEIKNVSEIKRASLNNVVGKAKTMEISKKEFLVALGLSRPAADKLLKLEGVNANICIVQDCGKNSGSDKMRIDKINELIKVGAIKETNLRKEFVAKIRQK